MVASFGRASAGRAGCSTRWPIEHRGVATCPRLEAFRKQVAHPLANLRPHLWSWRDTLTRVCTARAPPPPAEADPSPMPSVSAAGSGGARARRRRRWRAVRSPHGPLTPARPTSPRSARASVVAVAVAAKRAESRASAVQLYSSHHAARPRRGNAWRRCRHTNCVITKSSGSECAYPDRDPDDCSLLTHTASRTRADVGGRLAGGDAARLSHGDD